MTAVLSVLGRQSPLGQTAADPSEAGAAQATLQFQECLRAIEAQAETRGISKAIYEHLRVLSPRHEVLNAVQSQAEFETPIWEYIDASVTDTRIRDGKGKLAAKTDNAAADTDSVWAEEIDIDGDGKVEQTDLLYDEGSPVEGILAAAGLGSAGAHAQNQGVL